MKIFKTGTYTWWQVGLLKFVMLCFGIAIGSQWPELFSALLIPLLVAGFMLGIYLLVVWIRQ